MSNPISAASHEAEYYLDSFLNDRGRGSSLHSQRYLLHLSEKYFTSSLKHDTTYKISMKSIYENINKKKVRY